MRRRLALVLFALAAVAALVGAGPATAGLPSQAPPVAHDHASHHHGPDGLALDPGNGRGRPAVPAATYDVDGHAPWTEADWTAPKDPGADQPDRAELAGLPQVHAIYVYPAKAATRLPRFGAMFQADAKQADSRLASYGRTIRWDLRTDGKLDITSFQSKYRATQLAGANQFSLVANELASVFKDPNKKYVVWLDAGSKYCGQGTLWNDTSRSPTNASDVNRTTGIVYRPYGATTSTGGFCRGRTLLHELGHNLGAVLAPAPHSFDDAHCNDSAEDVMCYTSQTSKDTGLAVFDYLNDDYWDARATVNPLGFEPARPALPWWTVNLSRFLCPPVSGVPNCAVANSNPGYDLAAGA